MRRRDLDEITEVLLTVWALSNENYRGPLTRVIPPRLRNAARRARRAEYYDVDDGGPYLLDRGAAYLADQGFRGAALS
jgi:hypothetical protein